jgi:hypothetical protein
VATPCSFQHVVLADDDGSVGTEEDDRRKETRNDVLGDGPHPVEDGAREDDIQTNDCDNNVGDSSDCHTVRS